MIDGTAFQVPELGTLTRNEVAALAGVPLFPRDSGRLKGW